VSGPEFSLFNASDEWILHYVDDPVFEESLLLNVLFQDKILMHESYFFNSSLLSRHINRRPGRLSLFEYASLRGLIVPAIRDRKATSLAEAYEGLEGQFFKDFQLLIPEMQPFKDRIVGAVDAGLTRKNLKPFYWPEPTSPDVNLGHRYHELLKSLFQRALPPHAESLDSDRRQLFERVWEKSKRWRYDCFEQAAHRTAQNGNLGVQRLELIRSIGWSLGIPASQTNIEPRDILQCSDDPETRLAVEVFFKWLAQCHHLTQAQVFGTAINFPVYDLDEDFVLDSIFTPKNAQAVEPSADVLRCEVKLPPLESLISLAPQDVVAIRDDLGEGYRTALKRWQQTPDENNRRAAGRSLQDYCEMISRNYDDRHLEPLVATFGPSGSSRYSSVASVSTSVGSKISPGVGWLVTCSKLVFTTYQFLTKRRIRSRLATSNTQLEVTLAESVANSVS